MEEIELDFGAITLDSSILKGEGYRFHEGLLAQMQQFKESPVEVLQTDVVHNEAIAHIGEEIARSRSLVDQALRTAEKQLKIAGVAIDGARELLSLEGHESDLAEDRLIGYYESIGAKKIDSENYVDLAVLMDMYFSTKAPFEAGKDKKNEFPDAIALLALEGWAKERDIKIIAVSQDKGWKRYCDASVRITLVSTLAEALEKFQPHNKVASIIAKIREDSWFNKKNHILAEIRQAIVQSLDGFDITVEASSYMHVDWDDVSASYVSHELDSDKDGLARVRVIRIDDESIVLKVGATVQVNVEASFDFSVRDSIDKDYVSLGGNVCSVDESYHTDILLTLSGDFSKGFDNIEVVDIEVIDAITHANFGSVQPDWSSDYEDDER